MIDEQDKLLTIAEVAALLGVSRSTLRRWDATGYLKSVRVGIRRERKYKKVDIEKVKK